MEFRFWYLVLKRGLHWKFKPFVWELEVPLSTIRLVPRPGLQLRPVYKASQSTIKTCLISLFVSVASAKMILCGQTQPSWIWSHETNAKIGG